MDHMICNTSGWILWSCNTQVDLMICNIQVDLKDQVVNKLQYMRDHLVNTLGDFSSYCQWLMSHYHVIPLFCYYYVTYAVLPCYTMLHICHVKCYRYHHFTIHPFLHSPPTTTTTISTYITTTITAISMFLYFHATLIMVVVWDVESVVCVRV